MIYSKLFNMNPEKLLITVIILFIMAGCGGSKQSTDDFITVDVTQRYPKKELILQDFMDVEYIALETTDEFLCQGMVQDIGKSIIVITNQFEDGDIFIFNINGKGIRKFNRRGSGNEEYGNIYGITLDEDSGEIFVYDGQKIMVYDFFGLFKRRIPYNEGYNYTNIYNFSKDNLICDDRTLGWDQKSSDNPPFIIISKVDGSIVHKIEIPYKQKILPMITRQIGNSGGLAISVYRHDPIIPYHDNWILTEPSSDTIFRILSDYNLIPFIVRTPVIQSMDPEIFLFPKILTDRFYFLETAKKEERNFQKTDLLYDRQENKIYEYAVYNDDYSTKQRMSMTWKTKNDGIIYWQKIESFQLVEAYKKGELKGRLKEIAAGLDAEDNPVIMLVKHKK